MVAISFDLAVVGLGAVGSSALLAAARGGMRVIGIDRFAPPHALGSTHGETRIVREAIGEGAEYTPFARRSFAVWDQLARECGETLVTRCGVLVLGETIPHAAHLEGGFLQSTVATARAFQIPHEVLSAAQVRARFPAYASFEGARAYFEPGAGMAYPERVVAATLARAQALGAQVRVSCPALSLTRDGSAVSIRTRSDTLHAERVILAAGAWTPTFLGPEYARRLSVTRQTLHWFAPPDVPADFKPERMPAFIWEDLYGFPIATAGGGVKVATEALHDDTAPDDVRGVDAADLDLVLPRVRAAFPQLGAHLRSATCLYTSIRDSRFWIGPHPEMEQVTVVSACSGHGFKHAAAVGEAAVGGGVALPIPAAWTMEPERAASR